MRLNASPCAFGMALPQEQVNQATLLAMTTNALDRAKQLRPKRPDDLIAELPKIVDLYTRGAAQTVEKAPNPDTNSDGHYLNGAPIPYNQKPSALETSTVALNPLQQLEAVIMAKLQAVASTADVARIIEAIHKHTALDVPKPLAEKLLTMLKVRVEAHGKSVAQAPVNPGLFG